MIDDAELLRRYCGTGAESAFTEFVGRHVGLVYFSALRRTGDAALAQDTAQAVFTIVAQKAARLSAHPALAGWLYTTTRHLADKAVRKTQTRRRYEQEAAMHELTTAETSPAWEQLQPVIDDALDELDKRDREAILVRFFENRAFAEIGAALQISPDAARMRVDRALDRLRELLERRGIRSASAALAIALSTPAGIAVPAGLATAVSGAALATAASTAGTAVLFGFMSTTKTAVAVTTLAAVFATGFGIVERNRAQSAEAVLKANTQEQARLHDRLALAEKQLAQAENRAAEADRDSASLLAAVEAARVQPSSAPTGAGIRTARQDAPSDVRATEPLATMFPNGIVATVGDKTITVADVGWELAPLIPKLREASPDSDEFKQRLSKLQTDVVKSLVERSLLIKAFNAPTDNGTPRHIPATYVDQMFAETMTQRFANDQAKFTAYLQSRGITQAQYRQTLEDDIAYSYMRQQQRKLEKSRK